MRSVSARTTMDTGTAPPSSTSEGSGSAFVVGCRTRASAIFKPAEAIAIQYKLETGAVARLVFQTRFLDRKLSAPVPEDLWVHATGTAEKLESAIRLFSAGAQDVSIVIGLSANAWMGTLKPEVAFESTKEKAAREFWQAFVPKWPITAVPGRLVHVAATRELLRAIEDNCWRDRLRRAASQYHSALERWVMGSEVMAVAHLFMAVESLKNVAVERATRQRGLTRDELAESWGFRPGGALSRDAFLESTARRQLIFRGDIDCHRVAKRVSDSFEHGLVNSGKLWDDAALVAAKTASYTRSFIIEASEMSVETAKILLSKPYDEPCGPIDLLFCFRGSLEGSGESYAPAGSAYPIMKWVNALDDVVIKSDGSYGFRPKHSLTPRLGRGYSIRPTRFEVWGNAKYEGPSGEAGIISTVSRNRWRSISLIGRATWRSIKAIQKQLGWIICRDGQGRH